MKARIAVGLMSGTSLDGIDAALLRIKGCGPDIETNLMSFCTVPFKEGLRKKIEQIISSGIQAGDVSSLNAELGYAFSDAVKEVCRQAEVALPEVDFIGTHGQTIHHQPVSENGWLKSTLQLGEPAIIAYETGILTVSQFRTMDMAAGGEGAPLVPYTEWVQFQSERNRIFQNIGGIGNATVIPAGGSLDQVSAFDTGPGNMIIDRVCQKLFNCSYDEQGNLAQQGTVEMELIAEWMQHPFFMKLPPKSTGREIFGDAFTDQLIKKHEKINPYDLLASVTYLTARSIADAYTHFIQPVMKADELIVGGGGSHNKTILRMLKSLLPEVNVLTQEDIGYSSDAKEAIAFAVLANETLHQLPSNVPSATGAEKQVIAGSITMPPAGLKEGIPFSGGHVYGD